MHCRMKHLLGGLSLVFLLLFPFPTEAGENAWRGKIQQEVIADAEAGDADFIIFLEEQADLSEARAKSGRVEKGAYVYRTLSALAAGTQAPIIDELEKAGVQYRSFWVANMIAVRGSSALIEKLARRDDVKGIYTDRKISMKQPIRAEEVEEARDKGAAVEWNITMVDAPSVWAQGVTGEGSVVGGIDTGYEWYHPAIKDQYRGWNGATADHNYNWHDAIHPGGGATGGSCGLDSPVACDDHYHGTHTMGTMVGDDSGTNQLGMAPGAKWIGCRCMDEGDGTPGRYAECLQWMIAPTDLNGENPDSSKAPHVINNSWSCPESEGCTDPLVLLTAVNSVRAAGIVVVVSAGNEGSGGCNTVESPIAIYDASYSIGATNSSDDIASFSSRGNVTADGSGRMKPDVSAPGVGVRSCVPGDNYASLSGTSMAAPHVAGLVALLIEANPAIAGDVDLIETLINESAVPRTTGEFCGGVPGSQVPNNTYGWGRIDALAAYDAAVLLATGVQSGEGVPLAGRLSANRPNPFNPSTLIEYTLRERADVTICVYNVVGEQMVELVQESGQAPGRYQVVWDGLDETGRPAPSGVYFYRFESNRYKETRRMVLVR